MILFKRKWPYNRLVISKIDPYIRSTLYFQQKTLNKHIKRKNIISNRMEEIFQNKKLSDFGWKKQFISKYVLCSLFIVVPLDINRKSLYFYVLNNCFCYSCQKHDFVLNGAEFNFRQVLLNTFTCTIICFSSIFVF